MNVRLERQSIRVRVSAEEAATLARDGHLQERLPMPGGALALSVSCDSSDYLSLREGSLPGLAMMVPRTGLNKLLAALNESHIDKAELELRAQAEIGPDTLKISFEVDRFIRRPGHDRK